ncbi:hypothetical protein [Thiohalorhabdus denitrificans]|uniref:hypothetical protein n=1 Tax=Thiohalorhabdus denitrificans TaxID=381306 RepID=UPI00115FA38E|nr:hypothetical protein [Thiohalorhabdus denitrificans]
MVKDGEESPDARLVERDVVAEKHWGNPLDSKNNWRTEFWEEGYLRATLLKVRYGWRKVPALDFEGRRLNFGKSTDRSGAGILSGLLPTGNRRRVWRAGTTQIAEIYDLGPQDGTSTGVFWHGGMEYRVENPHNLSLFRSMKGPIRISSGMGMVGVIEPSPDSWFEWVIRPRRPVRFDVLLIAYHMAGWLSKPSSGGKGGGAAGGGGDGGC